MRLEDLFENQSLNEAPATAGVLNTGLDPAQFQQRTGLSPRQATRTIGNITQLNPQFKTPQFRNALTNYLVDNPKTFQAANQNFKTPTSIPGSRTPSKIATGAKGLLGRLLGPLAMALTPTTMGNGELDPNLVAAQNEVANFMDYLSKNNPQQYVDIVDAEMAARDDPNGEDLTTHPFYQRAKDALTRAATSGMGPAIAPQTKPDDAPATPTPANDPEPPIRVAPPPLEIPSGEPDPDIKTEPPTPKPQQTPPLPVDPVSPTGPLVIPPGGPKTDPGSDPKELPKDDPKAPPLDVPDVPGGPQIKPQEVPALPIEPTSPEGPKELPRRDPPKTDPGRGPVELPTDSPAAPPLDAPKTFPGPGLGTAQGTNTGILPVPRAGTGGNTRGRGGRGRGKLPKLGGGSEPDATQMQFAPINIRDPLNLKRFG